MSTFRFDNEETPEPEPHICESAEEFAEEKYIEEQYRTVDEMLARGEISKEERDNLWHELDLQYDPDTAAEEEEEKEEEMLEHMDDDWGETPETERERIDREYEEKCDALLDERFERDSDF